MNNAPGDSTEWAAACGMALHEEAGFVAVALLNGLIAVACVASMRCMFEFRAHDGPVLALRTHHRRNLLTSGADGLVRAWMITETQAQLLHEFSVADPCTSFALLPLPTPRDAELTFHAFAGPRVTLSERELSEVITPNQAPARLPDRAPISAPFSYRSVALERTLRFDAALYAPARTIAANAPHFSVAVFSELFRAPQSESYELLPASPSELVCASNNKLSLIHLSTAARLGSAPILSASGVSLPLRSAAASAAVQLPAQSQAPQFLKHAIVAVEHLRQPGLLLLGTRDGRVLLCK